MKVFFEKQRNKRLYLSLIGIFIIPLTFVVNSLAIDNKPQPLVKPTETRHAEVSVVEVEPKEHRLRVSGFAQARSEFQLDLTAQVSGRLMSLHQSFQTGRRVDEGTVIANIDEANYEQAVSAAKFAVEQANVSVLQEERKIKIVKKDRRNVSDISEIEYPLVFRKPQLKMAKAGLTNAKLSLKTAIRDLKNTEVRIPFNSIIVARHVAPGQYVQAGEKLASIYSTSKIEFRLSLPLNQWDMLPKNSIFESISSVEITSLNEDKWQGSIDRLEQHIDEGNRQKALIIKVDFPLEKPAPLLAGTFAKIELEFNTSRNLLAIPSKSINARGEVWYVNNKDKLAYFEAKAEFQQDGEVFINYPQHLFLNAANENRKLKILTSPLPTYILGQQVEPVFNHK